MKDELNSCVIMTSDVPWFSPVLRILMGCMKDNEFDCLPVTIVLHLAGKAPQTLEELKSVLSCVKEVGFKPEEFIKSHGNRLLKLLYGARDSCKEVNKVGLFVRWSAANLSMNNHNGCENSHV